MSRDFIRPARPSVDLLEGRLLLSSARSKFVGPPMTEYLSFQPPALVSQQATSATLTLTRSGLPIYGAGARVKGTHPLDDTVQVNVTTTSNVTAMGSPGVAPANSSLLLPPGPNGGVREAVAGVHYVPIDEVVTFLPGEATKTITLPIIQGADNPGRVGLGVYAVPTTREVGGATTTVFVDSKADVATPSIASTQLVIEGKYATGIAIRFNKPMDVASVTNPNGYKVTDRSHQYTKGDVWSYILFKSVKNYDKPVKITSATWDASTNTVTLIPKAPLMASGTYTIEGRKLPRKKGSGILQADRLVSPLRDESGTLINDSGSFGGGFFYASATRKLSTSTGNPLVGPVI